MKKATYIIHQILKMIAISVFIFLGIYDFPLVLQANSGNASEQSIKAGREKSDPVVIWREAEDFDRGAMYSRVVRQYLDFIPYLGVQREAYKRRLLRGQERSGSR